MSCEPKPLANDPLSDAQKLQIRAFVDSHLLTREDVPILEYSSRKVLGSRKKHLLEGRSCDCFETLAKTRDTHKPETLQEVRQIYESYHGKSFDLFRRTFQNPAERASELGLEPNRPDQAYAAQTWMKVLMGKYIDTHGDFNELKARYRNKMASAKGANMGYVIGAKKQLLMLADPVQKPTTTMTTPLDTILANTHFFVPKNTLTTTTSHPEKGTSTTQETYTLTREETRNLLKTEFTRLYHDPVLKHVLEALGTLIQKEGGHILISGSMFGPADLGKPYHVQTSMLAGTHAFYNYRHTLILASLINPYTKSLLPDCIGSFIHEALHFLFQQIVKNHSSPVAAGSPEEKLLDDALSKDRAHRKTIDPNRLCGPQASVWATLVTHLEENPEYFRSGGLIQIIPEDVMRSEAIVRVMEQVASGVPLEAIRAIAPNLCDFYFTHSKPLLEKFVADSKIPSLLPPSAKSQTPPAPSLLARIKAFIFSIFHYIALFFRKLIK